MAKSSVETEVARMAKSFPDSMQSVCQLDRHPVLLVDDDPTVRAFFRRALHLFGYQVDAVSNCRGARKKLVSGHYSTILLDVVLPDSSGIVFYYRLKARRPELAARVIFLTGAIARYPWLGALRVEGRPVLLKPTPLSEVLLALRKMVSEETLGPTAGSPCAH